MASISGGLHGWMPNTGRSSSTQTTTIDKAELFFTAKLEPTKEDFIYGSLEYPYIMGSSNTKKSEIVPSAQDPPFNDSKYLGSSKNDHGSKIHFSLPSNTQCVPIQGKGL